MSTVADYIGRTYDVLAFRGADATKQVELSQTLADEGGEICTGIQKLAQKWLLEMLTMQGSMPFLPTRGTTFLTAAFQGRLQTELDVRTAFALAAADIKDNLSKDYTDNTPDDERLESSTLLSVTINPDGLAISVRLLSLAGTTRAVILPIGVVV